MNYSGAFSDFYSREAIYVYSELVKDEWGRHPEAYPKCMRVRTSTRPIEQTAQLSGVGLPVYIPEGGNIPTDEPVQGYKATFEHRKYGLAAPTSREMVDDDKFDVVENTHRAVSRSIKVSIDMLAVTVYNNAFSTNGLDGVPLCSDSHPLKKAGGVQSNIVSPAADLGYTSLQDALTQFEAFVDSAGLLAHIQANSIMVHRSKRWKLAELLKSPDRPDTANRAKNVLSSALDGMPSGWVNPYLTNPGCWFLLGPVNQLPVVFYWRKQPYTKSWFEEKTETGYLGIRYRLSYGWKDYLGVLGSGYGL